MWQQEKALEEINIIQYRRLHIDAVQRRDDDYFIPSPAQSLISQGTEESPCQ